MPNEKDLEVVAEIAEAIAEEDEGKEMPETTMEEGTCEPTQESPKDEDSVSPSSSNEKPKKKKGPNNPKTPSARELLRKKEQQKLEERKTLLRILSTLLGIQIFFMNVVVLLIAVWCVFDFDFFREVDANILSGIFDFTKYYVTAVLVELLGGIIFIVHNVFSEKTEHE